MKYVLIISLISLFSVGCTTVKDKMESSSNPNHKVLKDCADKGKGAVSDDECKDAAKDEGSKVKGMMGK